MVKQRNVPNVEDILQYLTQKTYPRGSSASRKRSLRRSATNNYKLDRGTLYYKCQKRIIVDIEPSQSNPPPEADPEWRKYIQDENERNEIFVSMHSSAQGGHLGRDKTWKKISRRYW